MSALVAGWLLTYLVHSTLLLVLAWLADRLLSDRQLALRETLWRLALFGGLLTASAQLATGVKPYAGSWSLAATASPVRSVPLAAPPVAADAAIAAARPAASGAPAAATVAARRSQAPPDGWERRLVQGWALVGLPLLALLAGSYVRLRRRLRTRVDLDGGDLVEFLRRLEARGSTGRKRRRRPVRLTRSRRIRVPLARGVRRREICLPAEALERLPAERQEIVVAHELAHLDRRDPLWFALTRVLERALFFQPFNALARRQLQEISEFRCDDWAVAVTRRPISLAKCLAEVAEWSVRGRAALPVPTMAAGETHLRRRVARLLQRSYPMPNETVPRWLAPAALALLLLTVLIAPGVSAHAPESPDAAPEIAPPVAPPAPELPSANRAPVAPEPPAPVLAPSTAVPALPASPVAPSAPALPPAPPAPVLADAFEGFDPFDDFGAFDDFDDFENFDDFDAFDAFDAFQGFDNFDAFEALGELDELTGDLVTDLATELMESLELDGDQVERLREMAERLEAKGYATEAETARLAEMAERLIETARPSREQLERLRERERALTEARRRALEEHRDRMREQTAAERAEMERARAAIRRSLDERRELLEQARRQREESLRGLDREHRERLRQEMLRAREELREQLRRLDRELQRQERAEGPGERPEPLPE